VRAGEAFTADQRAELDRVVAAADSATGLRFCLHVGPLEGGRSGAEALLAARGSLAPDSVLVAVDPAARDLQIVTGSRAAQRIDDRSCALASLAMTSSFSAGDLVGGLRNGVQVLADHGRNATRRHLDTF
jgi:Domain of unknown function (DUF5130)